MGNFGFEHRLVQGAGPMPRHLERLAGRLAGYWALIANEGDGIWWPYRESPEPLGAEVAREAPQIALVDDPRSASGSHELVFWADDEWARQAARDWGFPWRGCDPGVVARVNSRRFQTGLEWELGVAPPSLRLAENMNELSGALSTGDYSAGWVLKTEFGNAGRQSRRGSGDMTDEVAAWANRRFKKGLAIAIEPRLEPITEASVQFDVDRSGATTCLGVVGCESGADGTFRGSRLLSKEESAEWDEARAIATAAAERIAEEGYHGALGIDAMRYRDAHGVPRLRPVQDINARFTFGRLALRCSF